MDLSQRQLATTSRGDPLSVAGISPKPNGLPTALCGL